MKNTTNYSLLLPDETDLYRVEHSNSNMQVIDTQMKSNENAAKNHIANKSNPHGVTKEQVGLGNVPNVATNDQTPTYSDTTTLATLASGEKLNVAFQKIKLAITTLINHIGNKSNPHTVTKAQIGLGSVDNTSDASKPISTATQTALNLKADASLLHNRIPQYFNVTSQEQLDSVMNEHSANFAINSYYNFTLSVAVGNLSIKGGTYYVEGMKTSAEYEWQRLTKYPDAVSLQTLLIMGRSKYAGTWTAWENIITQTAFDTKVDKVSGKALSTNDYTTAEKTKLSGIATGAQVNSITGVKGSAETSYRTGQVNITAENIGLGNVNNTADSAKNVLSATKLTTARTISLTGDVTGSVSFDGSGNASMTTTVVDSSHNHNISNVSGLQVALDDKVTKGMFGNGRMRFQWIDSSSQLHLFVDDVLIGKVTVVNV